MHELTTMATADQTMSSREIAELTDKQHKDVLRDIRTMLDGLSTERSFGLSEYTDSTGRKLPCYNLPKRETLILVSGYSVELRARIIDRWQELEESPQPALPQRSQAREIVEDGMAIAALFEVPKHYAQIVVTKEARRVTGVDYAPLLLKAPAQDAVQDDEVMLEPTELAARLGWKDGAEANRKLAAMGLQRRHKGHWSTTRKGDELAQRHSWSKGEKSGYNYKWNLAGIKDLLTKQ